MIVSNAAINARKNAPFKPTITNPSVKQTVKMMIDSILPLKYCPETLEILPIISFACSVVELRLSFIKKDSYLSRWYKNRNINMITSTVDIKKSTTPINDLPIKDPDD